MKYMNDYPSNKSGFQIVQEIIQICIDDPPFRDEIYAQICKQVSDYLISK